jgi:hypothetical protein
LEYPFDTKGLMWYVIYGRYPKASGRLFGSPGILKMAWMNPRSFHMGLERLIRIHTYFNPL